MFSELRKLRMLDRLAKEARHREVLALASDPSICRHRRALTARANSRRALIDEALRASQDAKTSEFETLYALLQTDGEGPDLEPLVSKRPRDLRVTVPKTQESSPPVPPPVREHRATAEIELACRLGAKACEKRDWNRALQHLASAIEADRTSELTVALAMAILREDQQFGLQSLTEVLRIVRDLGTGSPGFALSLERVARRHLSLTRLAYWAHSCTQDLASRRRRRGLSACMRFFCTFQASGDVVLPPFGGGARGGNHVCPLTHRLGQQHPVPKPSGVGARCAEGSLQ
jgi:hypothetical protein